MAGNAMNHARKRTTGKGDTAAPKGGIAITAASRAGSTVRKAAVRPIWSKGIDEMQRQVLGVHTRKSTVAVVQAGLPIASIGRLRERLNLDKSNTLKLLGISAATMSRREKSEAKRLDSEESDRVMRYGRLLALSIAMMEGDEDAARRWLHTPDDEFGGQNPLEYSRTEAGFREVEQLINRIEHGVYS
jgi:putative toxin-antitoxin system antitoxin component (TIGR02293 family)